MLSFSHPALLQAILALGSLQIAKLQGAPPTASLRHYHLALRRIAKNVGRTGRRAQPANLAATLLLAFYEVWNSDHEKWSKHLLGARWIFREIPLAEMTRSMMAMKTEQRNRREQELKFQQTQGGFAGLNPQEEQYTGLYRDWDEIDVDLLRIITGKNLTYDEFGMIPEDFSAYTRPKKKITLKDVETYEKLSDLFWWYGKMDVYQSILGGTRPL